MRELASVELRVLAKELKVLEGSYLKKFYDLGNGSFELFFSSNKNEYIVYCRLLKSINITSYTSEHENATNFAVLVRKRLLGKKLVEVAQLGSDRILLLDFSEAKIFIEMLGRGNFIIADKDNVIIDAYTRIRFNDRSLEPKAPYIKPKGDAIGVDEINEENAKEKILAIANSDSKIISVLSRLFEIGPLYIEDSLIRNGIDPKEKANKIEKEKLERVAQSIACYKESIEKSEPRIYYKDDEKDYAIVEISKYKGYEEKRFNTLSELLDSFYLDERQERQESEAEKANAKEIAAINSSIDKQKELIKQLEKDEIAEKEKGDIIFANMNIINQAIDYARNARKFTAEELKRFDTDSIKFIGVDLKNKRIKIKAKKE
jgi:predicted ribosome quality control (RQC) complex YloA/Tae2 family protein